MTTEESYGHFLIPDDRTFIVVLETRRMVCRGDPFYLKSDVVGAKMPVFNRY